MANDDVLNDLISSGREVLASRELKQKHPYIKEIIEVLLLSSHSQHRQFVIKEVVKKRKEAGLNPPSDETVQSAYNRYCVDSEVFQKRKAPDSDGLFYSPQGKGSGWWAVNHDRGEAWIRAWQAAHI